MPHPDHLIFVNYRGTDEIWATEFVYARMTEAFGAETVFKAGNALKPGEIYSPILLAKANSCPVMLACVGPAWLAAQSADGRRRLDSPDDYVRREIATSMRAGNWVVPLLLGDEGTVKMPKTADLPTDLRTLFGRQAARLTPGGGLDLTMPRLIDKLVTLVPELGARRQATASRSAAPAARPVTAVTPVTSPTPANPRSGAAILNFHGRVNQVVAGDEIVYGQHVGDDYRTGDGR